MHEVGWRLREDAWGQGYAKEAAIASLDFAFDALGAERVVAITFPGNEAELGADGAARHDPPRPSSIMTIRAFRELNPTIVYDIRPGELRR